MPRRARPYLYKVSGVRMRHTLRTGNKSTNKHATTTTTIADAAKLAGNIAHASLGLSPRHPPPRRLPSMAVLSFTKQAFRVKIVWKD